MDANCTSGKDSHENTVSELVSLAINRIRPFEHSPRRRPHEARLRLKQSIRQHGLDHALVVTQPPNSTDYVLAAGGAIRLSVLHELAAEAGGSRFSRVPCVVVRWPGQTELILAHLRENVIAAARSNSAERILASDVAVIDLDTKSVEVVTDGAGVFGSPAVGPDGTVALVGYDDATVFPQNSKVGVL